MREIILEQTHRLLGDQLTPELLAAAERGQWPAALWSSIEDAGLTGALAASARGGVGLDAADAFAIVRASGYHALPAPLPETIVAQRLWTDAGGALLTGPVSLAPPDEPLICEDSRLSGVLSRVPWGRASKRVVTLATNRGGQVFLASFDPEGVEMSAGATLADEPRDTLVLTRTPVELVPATVDAAALERAGALVRACQMAGAMERALELTITYVNQREQFGRALAKFQAVQQAIAIAATKFAHAAAAAGAAARAFGTPAEATAVAVAKSLAGEAARVVAETSHQMHAAMGFTREYPLHHYTRRLWSWREEFGREAVWEARLGRAVCAAGGAAVWPGLTGG